MITMDRPQIERTRVYTINETMQLLSIARTTLRVYEQKGFITSSRTKAGRRVFKGSQIIRCWSHQTGLAY